MKKQVVETVFDGKQLFYINLGKGSNQQFRLWVDQTFVIEKDGSFFANFPITNCDLIQLENEKDLIVKPGELNLFYFYVLAGYKGESTIDSIDADQPYQVFRFIDDDFSNLMVSMGVLVLTRSNKVKIRWHRDGHFTEEQLLEGVTLLYDNGRKETIPNDEVLKYL